MYLKEVKQIYHKELDGIYPKEEVDSFFYLLVEHYLGLERFVLVVQPNLVITKEEEKPFFSALSRLKLQCPLQYITGETSFMDLDLEVDANVLIPRPETEELVHWIIDKTGQSGRHGKWNQKIKILDIGTGSGCIAISLAKNLSNAKIYALDVSSVAIEVAQRNAFNNEVEVEFMEGDILDPPILEDKFDIIVSNPPYVRNLEKQEIQDNVLEYEPHLALFVSDENPLIFYKAIAQFAVNHLSQNGSLYLEINQYLGKETEQLLKEYNFSEIELRKDMFGNDRMLKAVLQYHDENE